MSDASQPRRSTRNHPTSGETDATPSTAAATRPPVQIASKKGTKRNATDEEKAASAATEPIAKKSKQNTTKLAVGDKLPNIVLKDDKDTDVDVSTLSNVVFFIYPKAATPGCTTQACNFRDGYKEFEDVGFKIFGLSADTVSAQSNWSSKHALGYPLLSDRDKQLLTALGCIQAGRITRSHVVVGKEGKIEMLSIGVKPANSKVDCLEAVKKLQ